MPSSNLEKDQFFVALVREGKLSITRKGVVKNNSTGRHIGYLNGGYWQISYRDENSKIIYKMLVHRLVWLVFRGPIPQGMLINHKDENPGNASLENLDLVNDYQNIWYSKNNKSYDAHLPIEEEWLKLIKDDGFSCNEIARSIGISAATVSRRLKKYKLEDVYKSQETARKCKIPKDMQDITTLVKTSGYVIVAKELGVSPLTVRNWFRMAGIEAPRFRRLRSDAGKKKNKPPYP